jgi:Pyocin activator protein PrtN
VVPYPQIARQFDPCRGFPQKSEPADHISLAAWPIHARLRQHVREHATKYGLFAYGAANLEFVCRDYFRHLTVTKPLRKVLAGQIKLPIVRIEDSQQAAKGVHLTDLADYLDLQRGKALKESRQLGVRMGR